MAAEESGEGDFGWVRFWFSATNELLPANTLSFCHSEPVFQGEESAADLAAEKADSSDQKRVLGMTMCGVGFE
jgi:hypothetical protein